MIGLARKAFRHVPFPRCTSIPARKFAEMYAFRDATGQEWELDLKIDLARRRDPSIDPATGRALRGAQDRRAEARARKYGLMD